MTSTLPEQRHLILLSVLTKLRTPRVTPYLVRVMKVLITGHVIRNLNVLSHKAEFSEGGGEEGPGNSGIEDSAWFKKRNGKDYVAVPACGGRCGSLAEARKTVPPWERLEMEVDPGSGSCGGGGFCQCLHS
eukprot:1161289-Pelagomonas_calceolata.AAC.1